VSACSRNEIKEFIETLHYSHNINGVMSTHCFKLMDGESLIGAMIYGSMGMANAWKKYGDSESDVIELRRLVLIDDTKHNAESFFIGATLRWLKKNTEIKTVVSYADPNNGHTGVIYRASNFKHVGMTSPGKVLIWNGRQYHDKAIRTKYKGELKPFAKKLKEALINGEAVYHHTKGKYIYVFKLRHS